MHQFNWDYIRYFIEVVDSGSATSAAKILGVNQSTVSRRLSQLEKQLGVRLFDRSTSRGWVLTTVGEKIMANAKLMSENAASIQRNVLSDSTDLEGSIKLTIGDVPNVDTVLEVLDSFNKKYPMVEVELNITNDIIDIAAREADIAIRALYNPPADLIGKRVGTVKLGVFGTQARYEAYLAGDRNIPCINWEKSVNISSDWIDENFAGAPILESTKPKIAFQMAMQGMGLVQTSCYWVNSQPGLVKLPIDTKTTGPDLWIISHVDLRTTLRLRLLRDELYKAFKKQMHVLEGYTPEITIDDDLTNKVQKIH